MSIVEAAVSGSVYFALRGHVYYAARENTTITAMASLVHRLLPRGADDHSPVAIRWALDRKRAVPRAHLWMRVTSTATTQSGTRALSWPPGLHLAQFRHRHRPLAQAVDYAELFIYDEAQQEAALGDVAILGALPRKCLVLRLGDPQQTSGGTGPGRLAPAHLPQELPQLIGSLLLVPG